MLPRSQGGRAAGPRRDVAEWRSALIGAVDRWRVQPGTRGSAASGISPGYIAAFRVAGTRSRRSAGGAACARGGRCPPAVQCGRRLGVVAACHRRRASASLPLPRVSAWWLNRGRSTSSRRPSALDAALASASLRLRESRAVPASCRRWRSAAGFRQYWLFHRRQPCSLLVEAASTLPRRRPAAPCLPPIAVLILNERPVKPGYRSSSGDAALSGTPRITWRSDYRQYRRPNIFCRASDLFRGLMLGR